MNENSNARASVQLIGVAGRAGAGKDTVGDILVGLGQRSEYNDMWAKIAFAQPIKDACREWFDFSDRQMYGSLEEKSAPDKRYLRPDGSFLSPREAMQFVGTELGRALYPNIWVDLALRRATSRMQNGYKVVITDCRFVNEAKAIREAGGEVWRVRRASAEEIPATHDSERMVETPEFKGLVTRDIYNEGSLEDLRRMVCEIAA